MPNTLGLPQKLEEDEAFIKTKVIVNPVTKRETVVRFNAKHLSALKDELEYATNWRRPFTDLYTQLKWLNAYAKINTIALFK